MDFISPNGDLPYNNNKDDEEIKVKEVNALKINKPIIPSNTPEGDNAAYQIEYEETLSKIQKYKYNLKKEGAYCLIKCCFKNNIKIFFILNSFIFFFMIITAVFQVTATLEYNSNVQEWQLKKQVILNDGYNSLKSLRLTGPDLSKSFICNNGIIIPFRNIISYDNNNYKLNNQRTNMHEYIIYDTTQVKIRYIIQVERSF